MAHDARSVANELISRAINSGSTFTPMQVVKLVYFCHAWMLGLYHRPLLEQPVEAWRYGPVVPEVYFSLRRYGGEPVRRPIEIGDEEYDKYETDLIDQVFQKYGVLSGRQHSGMTHAPGTPWHITWNRHGQNAVIPDPLIEDYYQKEAEKGRENG